MTATSTTRVSAAQPKGPQTAKPDQRIAQASAQQADARAMASGRRHLAFQALVANSA